MNQYQVSTIFGHKSNHYTYSTLTPPPIAFNSLLALRPMKSSPVFGHYARYYDLMYKDKDYVGETAYVQQLIQAHFPAAKSILNLGCGSGRHDIEMARLGYQVHGMDRSTTMLEMAHEKRGSLDPELASRLQFSEGDVRDFQFNATYDVVTALFHVMSYQTTDGDLNAAFDRAFEHLNPNGLLVFDCWFGPAVLHDRPEKRHRILEDAAVHISRNARPLMRPELNTVEVHYDLEITDKLTQQSYTHQELHPMRYLFEEELQALIAARGLELLVSEQWMTGRPLDNSTWYACFVARKPANNA